MQIENKFNEYTNIEKGVRHVCIFSLDLFKRTRTITHNIYMDNTFLMAESERNLKKLRHVVKESEKKGFAINCKKTEWHQQKL